MNRYTCMIIDDEELARTLLQTYVSKVDYLELSGSYESPLTALSALKKNPVDVVFLDIQMPELKGTDFAKLLPEHTKIIFTTAYSDYALQGFELNAIDYLLKPITFTRFLSAVERIKGPELNQNKGFITIKSGYDRHRVNYDDILYLESQSEYVMFHLQNKKILSYTSLKKLEASLPPSQFMRVHRSYMVNRSMVSGLKGKSLIVKENLIPVSSTYFDFVVENLFD